jgi:hypothetical protein
VSGGLHPSKKRTHNTKTAARGSNRSTNSSLTCRVHRLRRLRTSLPVSAIFALDDLPENWQSYIEKNSNYVEGGKFKPDKYRPGVAVNHGIMTLYLLMSNV